MYGTVSVERGYPSEESSKRTRGLTESISLTTGTHLQRLLLLFSNGLPTSLILPALRDTLDSMATAAMDPPVDLPALDLFSLKGLNALITGATRGESNADRLYHIVSIFSLFLCLPLPRRSIALFLLSFVVIARSFWCEPCVARSCSIRFSVFYSRFQSCFFILSLLHLFWLLPSSHVAPPRSRPIAKAA